MKLESLPAIQGAQNRRHSRFLSVLFTVTALLFAAGLGAGFYLYFYPPVPPDTSASMSHGGTECNAIVVAPTLTVCEGKLEGEVVFTSGSVQIPGVVIRVESVTDQAALTLVRLKSPAPTTSLHQPSTSLPGQKYVASMEHQTWEGTLSETPGQKWLTPTPAFSFNGGAAVLSPADASLVGIAAQSSSGVVVVPMPEVLARFPEISGGR